MRLLVLGGTAWLGREVAATAVSQGHEVTCLARGSSGDAPAGVHLVVADRDRPDAYDPVAEQRWDAVVDVARQPGHVRRAAAALEPLVDRFLFVSSCNVYASQCEVGADEGAALLTPLQSDVMESMEQYGQAKVACEQAAADSFGAGRTLIARVGLIGGPGDASGRSGYWPWRFAQPSNRQGAVLVPDAADLPTAVIDVRDLAGWLVDCADAGTVGVFNAGGDAFSLAEHLTAVRKVAGHTGPVVTAPEDWLRTRGVQNWSGPRSLPLWLDDRNWYGMNARDCASARAAGLIPRPLEDTLADTLVWELARPEPRPHGAGLSNDEERDLLDALARTNEKPMD